MKLGVVRLQTERCQSGHSRNQLLGREESRGYDNPASA